MRFYIIDGNNNIISTACGEREAEQLARFYGGRIIEEKEIKIRQSSLEAGDAKALPPFYFCQYANCTKLIEKFCAIFFKKILDKFCAARIPPPRAELLFGTYVRFFFSRTYVRLTEVRHP